MRSSPRVAVSKRSSASTLKQPMVMVLPFAPEPVISAINRGVPLVLDATDRPIGAALEDCAFLMSKEAHRKERPAKPTDTWQRVDQRSQQRRQPLAA